MIQVCDENMLNTLRAFIYVLTIFCTTASGQVILDRSTLDAMLGENAISETFERIPLSVGSGVGGDGTLSAISSGGSWPDDMIVPGLTLRSAPENNYLEWNYFDEAYTKTLVAGTSLTIQFWNPATAFGINLKDFATRRVLVAGVTVFGPDNFTVLYSSTNLAILDPTTGTFFGYSSSNGIGSVTFHTVVDSSGPGYSPTIDNLSFSPIPEPSTTALGALGLLGLLVMCRRERR